MKLLCKKILTTLVLSLLTGMVPASAHAYVVWSGIYLGTPWARGISQTVVDSSEDYIVYIEVYNEFGSYWHGYNFDSDASINAGTGTQATAEAWLWRSSEDWWWVIGVHFFLEDDLNTFDEVTFSTIFW